jgi:hypothetical protein
LAFWNDPISQKDFKYVFLAASSSLKGLSDKQKYEKSRKLKVRKFSLCAIEILSRHVQIIAFLLGYDRITYIRFVKITQGISRAKILQKSKLQWQRIL